MTGKADFSEAEWEAVLEGPTSAGVIVMSAERGGSFREAFALAKVYAEARKEHGASALLDEITAHKPEVDRTRAKSFDELQQHGLDNIRAGLALVDAKASPEEAGEYRRFIGTLAQHVAKAKQEKGSTDGISEHEQQALDAIEGVLGDR